MVVSKENETVGWSNMYSDDRLDPKRTADFVVKHSDDSICLMDDGIESAAKLVFFLSYAISR